MIEKIPIIAFLSLLKGKGKYTFKSLIRKISKRDFIKR